MEDIITLSSTTSISSKLDKNLCYDECDNKGRFKRSLGKFLEIQTMMQDGGDRIVYFDGGGGIWQG